MRSICTFTLLLTLLAVSFSAASTENVRRSVLLSNGHEIDIEVYSATGNNLLLWLPSEHGLTAGLNALATALSELGVEVWIADPFSTWFLSTTPSSLQEIDQLDYLQLINKANETKKMLTLASNDRGSSVLLQTAKKWQLANTEKHLTGAILLSPNLYVETPGSGREAQYLPVTHSTNLNMLLLVPRKSTGFLRIMDLQMTLAAGGSSVYIQPVTDSRDRFFFRDDATDEEQEAGLKLAEQITSGIKLLAVTPRTAKLATLEESEIKQKSTKPTTGKLLPFKGGWKLPVFSLSDLGGENHSVGQYTGNVVLVNFWASWCPPCIHEIPSMSVLQTYYKNNNVKILAINLGEPRKDIEVFLQKHPVNFTVLLDPDQTQPEKWKVFAFPTSYLIDKKGRIRYSIAGGIDWNSKEVIQKITALVNE